MKKQLAICVGLLFLALAIGTVEARSRPRQIVLAHSETGNLWYDYRAHAVYWNACISNTVFLDTNRNHTFFYYSQSGNWDLKYGDRADIGLGEADQWGHGFNCLGAIGTLQVDPIRYGPLSVPKTTAPTNWLIKVATTHTFYWQIDYGIWRCFTPRF